MLSSDNPRVPPIPLEIVEYLDRLFPDRCASLTDSDREVWFKAGAVSVVRKLRLEHEAQHERAQERT